MKRMLVCAIVVLLLGATAACCPQGTSTPHPTPTPTSANGNGGGTMAYADLMIYEIQVDELPQPNTPFCVEVWVTNVGDVSSGSYDLTIGICDLGYATAQCHLCLQSFNEPGLTPGQIKRVYFSCAETVPRSGNHELYVEMAPSNDSWVDGNPDSNQMSWYFAVMQ